MIKKEEIIELAEGFLGEKNQFIVKLNIGTDNKISLYIDGDEGVTIDDCVSLSRLIENTFDREEEDYELNVSSAGIDQPYSHIRQYRKNIGRTVEISKVDGTIVRGILEAVDEHKLQLAQEVIKKNRKSKKMITGEIIDINMSDIAQAKTIIIF
jgi:ribosome maturation factor RimP